MIWFDLICIFKRREKRLKKRKESHYRDWCGIKYKAAQNYACLKQAFVNLRGTLPGLVF